MLVELCIFGATWLLARLYLWYKHRMGVYKMFKNLGINGPEPSLLGGGNYIQLMNNTKTMLDLWPHEYGNHFGYFIGECPYLVISDIDAIQQIFTNSKVFREREKMLLDAYPYEHSLLYLRDQRWKHVRKMITPTFSHHKVSSQEITTIMNSCVDTLDKRLQSGLQNGVSSVKVDILDRMQCITLDVICRCALSMEKDVQQPGDDFMQAVRDYMGNAQNMAMKLAILFPFLIHIFSFMNNHLTAGKMTDMIMNHLKIQIMKECENARNASQTESMVKQRKTLLNAMLDCVSQDTITKDELMGNALVVLLGGYDTTSLGLTFTFYLLAKHQDIQDRLREELNTDGIKSTYLDMVWNESLRLYPPVITFVNREAGQDMLINNIKIPKGVIVQASVWAIHHDENVWSDPYTFDPERFSPENRKSHHPAAFLTFGLGPRYCIGSQFALAEAKIIITKLICKYHIELCDQTPDPLELTRHNVMVMPKDTLYLSFTPIVN